MVMMMARSCLPLSTPKVWSASSRTSFWTTIRDVYQSEVKEVSEADWQRVESGGFSCLFNLQGATTVMVRQRMLLMARYIYERQ